MVVFIEKRSASHPEYSAFRSREIMTVRPVFCNPEDGFEYWEVCSWEKQHIHHFLEEIKKIGEARLLSMQRIKLQDVYHFRITPRLTGRQKQALDLAMERGYYAVPRKVDLDVLAKEMKITRQAFSEHLRKAEGKLMPAMQQNFLK